MSTDQDYEKLQQENQALKQQLLAAQSRNSALQAQISDHFAENRALKTALNHSHQPPE